MYTNVYGYQGSYLTIGGTSKSGSHGGPGTLFIKEKRFLLPYTILQVDNLKRSLHDTLILDEQKMDSYHFSEVRILRSASLTMALRNRKTFLKMDKLTGDRTGLIHAKNNHVVYLEASKSQHSVSKPAVNLRIDHGGEMVFGASFYIIGDGAKGTGQILGDSSFTVNGRMTDVNNMVVSKGLKVRFARNAHSASIIDGKPVISDKGTFVMGKLEIQDGAELLFNDSAGIQGTIGVLHMKYGSKIISDRCNISVTSLFMEAASTLPVSGYTRPVPNTRPTIPSSCLGSGGSYGSLGGTGKFLLVVAACSTYNVEIKTYFFKLNYKILVLFKGHRGTVRRPYGSLFYPKDYGSPGCPGNSDGGKAGGIISVNIGDELFLDGTIDVNGQNAGQGSNAGGASGGSIWISTGRFTGHGKISADGGDGDGTLSGGGSGGRIALINRHTQTKFLGTFSALGGQSGAPSKSRTKYSGGPGTVYLQDIRNAKSYSQLLIDNKHRPLTHYMTLNENLTSYSFDEVSLMRGASLQLISDNRPRNLTIHKIVGDRTGLLHIHKNQMLKAEYKPTSYTITRLELKRI